MTEPYETADAVAEVLAEGVRLQVEVARLQRELDEAREQVCELLEDALDHGGRSDLKAAMAERDALAAEVARLATSVTEWRELAVDRAARLERAEKVLEEAAEWRSQFGPAQDKAVAKLPRMAALIAAVDEYQVTPDTSEPAP